MCYNDEHASTWLWMDAWSVGSWIGGVWMKDGGLVRMCGLMSRWVAGWIVDGHSVRWVGGSLDCRSMGGRVCGWLSRCVDG